jgi:peptidoglycan hydrolase-like protein with peptidoglycan-binding domain
LEHRAAAAWNTMMLFIYGWKRVVIRPAGPRSSYRTLRWQRYFWNLFQAGKGNPAAYPGTSNHGWGRAVDVLTTLMAALIRRIGRIFGWSWDEGRRVGEWWHFRYVGGFKRPNPGPSLRYPVLKKGSGGPGQRAHVKACQRRLRKHLHTTRIRVDGDFGEMTKRSVRRFQRNHDLKPDGVVGRRTWIALRKPPRQRSR